MIILQNLVLLNNKIIFLIFNTEIILLIPLIITIPIPTLMYHTSLYQLYYLYYLYYFIFIIGLYLEYLENSIEWET